MGLTLQELWPCSHFALTVRNGKFTEILVGFYYRRVIFVAFGYAKC